MAVTKIKPIKSTLSKALDYIENPDKTDGKMLVSSFGCSYETADIEFEYTLSQALQKGNNLSGGFYLLPAHGGHMESPPRCLDCFARCQLVRGKLLLLL